MNCRLRLDYPIVKLLDYAPKWMELRGLEKGKEIGKEIGSALSQLTDNFILQAEHLQRRGNQVFGFEDLPANLGVRDFDSVFQMTFLA